MVRLPVRVVFVICLLTWPVAAASGAEGALAKEVLELSGVQRGVCAVVGCDEEFVLELARASELLIHVRDPRAENVARLQAAATTARLGIQRLAVEQELDAFFPAVGHLAARAGHVFLVTAVSAGHAGRTLSDRCAIAVHASIAATENHDALAGKIDEPFGPLLETEFTIDVRHQVGQRVVHTGQVLARKAAFDIAVGPEPEEDGVVFVE